MHVRRTSAAPATPTTLDPACVTASRGMAWCWAAAATRPTGACQVSTRSMQVGGCLWVRQPMKGTSCITQHMQMG
jgi:hypothetical protein